MDWTTISEISGTALVTFTITRALTGGSWKLSGRLTSIESNMLGMQSNLTGVQTEIKRIGDVLVSIADVKGELRVLDSRISNAEQDIRDLQRGEGYVLPLNKSPHEKP